jgi:hypothetical protein
MQLHSALTRNSRLATGVPDILDEIRGTDRARADTDGSLQYKQG